VKRFEVAAEADSAVGNMSSVRVSVAPTDEWVYIDREGGKLVVWSGSACRNCQLRPDGLLRCSLHWGVLMIAVQYRLL